MLCRAENLKEDLKMRLWGKKRNRQGFTLQELLVTIAIIAVIAIISIPAIGMIQNHLHMKELDDTARQLFLSAQNEMTTMKATGELKKFQKGLPEDQSLGFLGLEPQDYTADDENWRKLYYINSEDTIAQVSLAQIVMDTLDGGSYILELNPVSGDVYGAFYSEHTLNYEEISQLASREKKDRMENWIGYYGGGDIFSGQSGETTELKPEMTITNKEDLYLKITCPDVKKAFSDAEDLYIMVTVYDEDKHKWVCETAADGSSDTIDTTKIVRSDISTDGTLTMELLLDSIELPFSEITGESGLKPGQDLLITAALTYDDGNTMHSGSVAGTVNSLFASKESDGSLKIGYLRQLNNLRASIYDYKPPEKSEDLLEEISEENSLTITLTQTIDFDATSWEEDARFSGHALQNPLKSFEPLENGELFQNGTVFQGNGNQLKNFVITGKSNVGLFASFGTVDTDPCLLQNIRLVDFKVSASETTNSYSGALCGQLIESDVKNCGVYLTTKDTDGKAYTDMEDREKTYVIKGQGNCVGGLIGDSQGTVHMISCFAAVHVSGNMCVGGLIGRHTSGEIQNSYASGSVTASSYAGGLVGDLDQSSLAECYATCNVTADSYGGGLIGRITGTASLQHCNSYGLVQKSENEVDKETSGGLIGKATGNIDCGGTCYYLKQKDYNDSYAPIEDGSDGAWAVSFAELKSTTTNSNENSHPYRAELQGTAFPFSMVQTDHYGDWPDEILSPTIATGICYYEKYNDGTYGFYALNGDGSVGLNTLAGNEVHIESVHGYGILCEGEEDPEEPVVSGRKAEVKGVLYSWNLDGTEYSLYPFTANGVQTLQPEAGQKYLTISDPNTNKRMLYINVNYAAAIYSSRETADAAQLKVRTIDQLDCIDSAATEPKVTNGWYIVQDHDILMLKDSGNYTNTGYTFDGNGNKITESKHPLFLTSAGILKKVALEDVAIYEKAYKDKEAALVNSNEGIIENCYSNGSVTTTGYDGAAAGLVLDNSGTILDSYSSCSLSANGDTAGLAVKNTAAGILKGCSFSGDVETASYNFPAVGLVKQNLGKIDQSYCSGTVTGKGNAFGFVNTNEAGVISGCYVTGTVKSIGGGTVAAGLAGKNTGTVSDSYVTGMIESTGGGGTETAGLIWENNGKVTDSYVAGTVKAIYGGDKVAGLAGKNSGTISDSYVTGMVQSNGGGVVVAGLICSNMGTVSKSYVANIIDSTGGGSKAAGLIWENIGTAERCYAQITINLPNGDAAAGLVGENTVNSGTKGEITDCYSKGDVTIGNGGATGSGLFYMNQGHISYSYANCITYAEHGSSVSGFGCQNQSGGIIENCYAVGIAKIISNGSNAAGFVYNNGGEIQNSYALTSVTCGSWGSAYGFTNGGTVNHCYWGKDFSHNNELGVYGSGTIKTLQEICCLAMGTGWTHTTTAAQSHPDSDSLKNQAYPYPRIDTLDHWGDWPLPNIAGSLSTKADNVN